MVPNRRKIRPEEQQRIYPLLWVSANSQTVASFFKVHLSIHLVTEQVRQTRLIIKKVKINQSNYLLLVYIILY